MRISVVAILVLGLWPAHMARAEDPVYFADAALKAAVEDALWVWDPTPTDMLALTELFCVNRGVTDITGLEYAENLQHLNLRFNRISRVSALSGLTNLRHLDLSRNYEISSIRSLAGLTHLDYLNLHINQLESISALSDMKDLTYLDLHGNQIVDVSALSQMDDLEHLDLSENGVQDITPLAGLTKLRTLYLHYNQLQDISALRDLTALRTLNLYLNEIHDLAPLANMVDLRTLSFHYNQVSDISALAGLTRLSGLQMQANPLNAEACAVYLPLLLANNPGVHLEYDECQGGHTLTISSTEGGTVTEPGEGHSSYARVAAVAVSAAAFSGYRFLHWTGTAVRAGKVDNPNLAQATVTVDDSYSLRANFLREIKYVDDNAPFDPLPYDLYAGDPQEDGSIEHPFDSIQEAIAAVSAGGLVLVRPGVYHEAIDLQGKAIHVTGLDPAQGEIMSLPVIHGDGARRVVTFARGEDRACQLSGFVLTQGNGPNGAAIACVGSSPSIRNCLIVGNRCADPNAAIVFCQGGSPLLENLTVHGNHAGNRAAAFSFIDAEAVITNSILWENQPQEIQVDAGPDPLVSYSNVMGTWPGPGNIELEPSFVRPGSWTADTPGTWLPGDYHLMAESGHWAPEALTWTSDALTSLCIDAGDPDMSYGHEPFPNGQRINMGAYGGGRQSSRSVTPLLAYWRFDETAGQTARDSVGENHASVYGAVWTRGKVNGALDFDGLDDYVDCQNAPELAPDQFSLCLWVYPRASFGSKTVVQKGVSGAKDYQFELFGAQHPTFSFENGGGSVVLYSDAVVPANEWTHVVLVRARAEASLYVNGRELRSKAYGFAPPATDYPLTMGGADASYFPGKIDDVRLYDLPLGAEDIQAILSEAE